KVLQHLFLQVIYSYILAIVPCVRLSLQILNDVFLTLDDHDLLNKAGVHQIIVLKKFFVFFQLGLNQEENFLINKILLEHIYINFKQFDQLFLDNQWPLNSNKALSYFYLHLYFKIKVVL